jgi:hypothetical protein
MKTHLRSAAVALIVAGALGAQTVHFHPPGTDTEWGGSGNTIPFWGGSATYQQVMDHAYMAQLGNGQPLVITAMVYRARGQIAARSVNAQLIFNHTSIDAATAGTTFAANLQGPADPAPTTVIQYKTLNFPAFGGSMTGGMTLPLDTPFIWTPAMNKNFIYELRYKDGNPGALNGQLDAVDGNTFTQSRRPAEGIGCQASAQTGTCSATSTLAFAKGSSSFPAWNYTVSLRSARASAPAAWLFGFSRANIALPGGCAPLLLNPFYTQFGTTTAATGGSKPQPGGDWNVQLPVPQTPDYRLLPRFELFSQFAFDDPSLPYGVGVSDLTVVKTSFPGAVKVARIYAITTVAGNGFELATTGSKDDSYGLVTGFQ